MAVFNGLPPRAPGPDLGLADRTTPGPSGPGLRHVDRMQFGSRMPGRAMVVSGGFAYARFGPFEPGERVDFLWLYPTRSNAATGANFFFECWIEASANPLDSSLFATGVGRSLVKTTTATGADGIATNALLRLPGELGQVTLPLGWVATENERWLFVAVADAGSLTLGACSAFIQCSYEPRG